MSMLCLAARVTRAVAAARQLRTLAPGTLAPRMLSSTAFRVTQHHHPSTAVAQPLSAFSMRTPTTPISIPRQMLSHTSKALATDEGATVKVLFKDMEGGSQLCEARIGQHLLDVAIDNDIDLEGACGGTLACSTCHLIIDKRWYDMLDEPEEEEEDMLDLAFDLQDTSRLGCQIVLTKELDGIEVTLPSEQADARKIL